MPYLQAYPKCTQEKSGMQKGSKCSLCFPSCHIILCTTLPILKCLQYHNTKTQHQVPAPQTLPTSSFFQYEFHPAPERSPVLWRRHEVVIDEVHVVLACSPSHGTVGRTQTTGAGGLREAQVVQSIQEEKIRLCISFVSGMIRRENIFFLFSI